MFRLGANGQGGAAVSAVVIAKIGAKPMWRGLFSGVFWGALISGGLAAGLSLSVPLPNERAAEERAPVVTPVDGGEGRAQSPDIVPDAPDTAPDIAPDPTSEPPAETTPQAAPTPPATTPAAPTPAPMPADAPDISPTEPAPNAPEVEPAPNAAAVDAPAPAVPAAPETDPAAPPAVPAAPDKEPILSQPVPTPDTEAGDLADLTPSAEADPLPEPGGSLMKPAISLTERSAHKSTRLPTTSAPDAAAESAPARPIDQFAVGYANPDLKPLMSIVLIDDGTDVGADIGAEALGEFPYPLTIALDPEHPKALEQMRIYREAGFEVMSVIDLPLNATARDVETSLQSHLAALPESVGILGGVSTGLQGSKEISDQVAAVLADTGHGAVFQKNGLNTAAKLARKAGVPAASVFRDFDGKGQNANAIRRFLDQAAFKAGREGGVIMMGRLRPETVAGLLIWGLQDRAGTVALVPVSAVLNAK